MSDTPPLLDQPLRELLSALLAKPSPSPAKPAEPAEASAGPAEASAEPAEDKQSEAEAEEDWGILPEWTRVEKNSKGELSSYSCTCSSPVDGI